MRHVSEGELRRIFDDPHAVPDVVLEHYRSCAACRSKMDEIGSAATFTRHALTGNAPTVDAHRALAATRQRLAEGKSAGWRIRGSSIGMRPGGLAMDIKLRLAAGTAVVLAALVLTPAGSLAQNFFAVFQPTQVAALPVSVSDLGSLPQLRDYGTIHGVGRLKPQQVASAQAAASLSGLNVPIPSSLPPGIPTQVTYEVIPSSNSSFTFSAARARATAVSLGKTLPPMPRGLDGSSLKLTTGEGVVAVYGDTSSEIPALVIGEMKAPTLASTRLALRRLEKYLLKLPGVSAQLRQAITKIGDPKTTLPIPVPIGLATARDVAVQGVHGLTIGDNTGVGSGVVWVKNGLIYGVAGALKQDAALAIANSL